MEPVELVSMSASNWPGGHGLAGVQVQLSCKMSFMCTQVVQITVTVYLGFRGEAGTPQAPFFPPRLQQNRRKLKESL